MSMCYSTVTVVWHTFVTVIVVWHTYVTVTVVWHTFVTVISGVLCHYDSWCVVSLWRLVFSVTVNEYVLQHCDSGVYVCHCDSGVLCHSDRGYHVTCLFIYESK